MPVKLTDRFCHNAPATSKRQEIADLGLPGLYLIVQPTGAKSFAVRYSISGKGTKATLGSYPAIGLARARELAKGIIGQVTTGIDPKVAELERKQEEARLKSDKLEEVIAQYDKRRLSTLRPKTAYGYKWLLNRYLGDHMQTSIHKIRRRDYVSAINLLIEAGKVPTANRLQDAINALLTWCVNDGILDISPMAGRKQEKGETSRERVLSNDELRLVWLAAERIGGHYGAITRALILSGQRKLEVGGARWSEFTPIGNDGMLWTIPASRTKPKREQKLIIPATLADALLTQRRVNGSDYLFTTAGDVPVWSYSKAKRQLDEAIAAIAAERGEPVPDHWTFHDLRRTAATGMAALKIDPVVVELILNHAIGSKLAAIYNRHDPLDDKADALARWSAKVMAIVHGADVIPFPGRAG